MKQHICFECGVKQHICFECGADENLHNHHVVPYVSGGTKTIPLCGDCHGKVHGKNFGSDWRKLQAEGIAKAKAAGKFLGRERGAAEDPEFFLLKPKNKKIVDFLVNTKFNKTDIAAMVGCTQNLIRKIENLLIKQGIIKKIKRDNAKRGSEWGPYPTPKHKRILELLQQNFKRIEIREIIKKEFGSGCNYDQMNKIKNIIDLSYRTKIEQFAVFTNGKTPPK
jgi:predicted transcriptional regulator